MSVLAYYISLDAVAAGKKMRAAGNDDSPANQAEAWAAILRELIADTALSANELPALAARDFARMAKATPQLRFEESLPVIGSKFAELYLIEGASENGAAAKAAEAERSHPAATALSH